MNNAVLPTVAGLPPRPTVNIGHKDVPQLWFKWVEVEAYAQEAITQARQEERERVEKDRDELFADLTRAKQLIAELHNELGKQDPSPRELRTMILKRTGAWFQFGLTDGGNSK